MRAGLFLEALALDHEVSLLVVPVADPAPLGPMSPFVARRASRVMSLDLARHRVDTHLALIDRLSDPAAREAALQKYPRPLFTGMATPDTVRAAAAGFTDEPFDVVHVMRLYLAPFAAPWLGAADRGRRPRCVIDLDDDEVGTRRSLAALHAANDDAIGAARETREAERYAAFEREHLPRFDRVLVAARADAAALETRLGLRTVTVVPNAVRIPERRGWPPPAAWRLVFVGSLGYGPNADAAIRLCRLVLPGLREAAARPIEVQIVGSRPPPEVIALGDMPGVSVAANVPDVAPYYAESRVAVAPIRAGGGTRIKILEAFAHECPVVATSVAAAGIDAQDGVHLLVADEPDRFGQACLDVLRSDALAARLSGAARALVESRYAVPAIARRIGELYQALRLC